MGFVVSLAVICVIVGQLKSGLWVVFESVVVLEGRLAAVALPAELALLRPRSTSTSRCIYSKRRLRFLPFYCIGLSRQSYNYCTRCYSLDTLRARVARESLKGEFSHWWSSTSASVAEWSKANL